MPHIQPAEPLPFVLLMRVVNPRAPHPGETGRVVEVLREADDQQEMIYLKLEFEDGDQKSYERTELELCLP